MRSRPSAVDRWREMLVPMAMLAIGMAPPMARATPSRAVEAVHRVGAYRIIIKRHTSRDGSRAYAIIAGAGASMIIRLPGGLVTIKQGTRWSHLPANLLRSHYAYMPQGLKAVGGAPLAMFFGWPYQSDPWSLQIVALEPSGPRSLFKSKAFEVDRLFTAKDGALVLAGRSQSAEAVADPKVAGCDNQTYEPFEVYRLGNGNNGSFRYSIAASRHYTLKHYYGWKGRHFDGIVTVCRKPVRIVRSSP